jgi:hypothetical protein
LYNGTKIKCDEWKYWDLNEEYSFNTLVDTSVPVRTAKIFTPVPGYHLWHIEFTDFKDESAPVTDFNPPRGIKCIPALPALRDQTAPQSFNTLSKLVSIVSDRFHAAKTKATAANGTCCTTYPCSKYQVKVRSTF